MGIWVKNRLPGETNSRKSSIPGSNVNAMLTKGAIHLVHPKGSQFLSNLFLVPKKDGEGQACYHSEGIKFIHSLFSLQNGRFALLKDLLRERFYAQGVLERYLILRPFGHEPSKMSLISMERKHLRVLASMFRSGSSTWDFYKIIKFSHCNFEANSNKNNHLSGRYVAEESDHKWSKNSYGYIDFYIGESRFCYKSALICSGTLAKDRVSGVENRLSENYTNHTTGKSKKIETKMPKAYFKPQNDTVGSDQS